MQLAIRLYGDDVLRQRASEINEITPEIKALAESMLDIMYQYQGLGLAAPQVGLPVRLVVIDVPREASGKLLLVNPVIKEMKGKQMMEEGCLSFPDITVPVERATEITVEFTTLGGKRRSRKPTGVTAQAIQHEIDHLDGVLFIDRLSRARRALMSGKLRKLRKRGERGERR